MTDFLKIQDPDKPGDYLVLAQGDFDPAKHRLFSEGPQEGGERVLTGGAPAGPGDAPDGPPQKNAPARRG